MNRFEELKIWNEATGLAVDIYSMTKKFPKDEIYGITQQIRRSAVSVPSNIAEGAGRRTKPDFRRFLSYASGSAFELKTQLIIAEKIGYVNLKEVKPIIDKIEFIQRMNFKLQRSLE